MVDLNLAIREEIAKTWWMWLIRGILGIALAIFAFAMPDTLNEVLGIIIGLYFLIDGAISLFHGFGTQPEGESRMPKIIWGIIGIVAGLLVLGQPMLAIFSLTIIISIVAVIYGIFAIYAGWKIKSEISDGWWLIVVGIASILFGILIGGGPFAGGRTLAYLIGVWALINGISFLILSFRVKGLAK